VHQREVRDHPSDQDADNTVITADAVQTQNSTTATGTPAYAYSTDGKNEFQRYPASGNACSSSTITVTLSPNRRPPTHASGEYERERTAADSVESKPADDDRERSRRRSGRRTASTVADVALYY